MLQAVLSSTTMESLGMRMSSTSLMMQRASYQAHKKKFAEDLAAAVQSSWGTLRQVVEAKRAEAREAQKQWIKKRKVEVVEIGSRIDDTPDVSDLGDVIDTAPMTEQQVVQEKELVAASIKEEARRRRTAKNHPSHAPFRVRGQPLHIGSCGTSPLTAEPL